ncbi:MAG TPA: pyridoxine 5'-phosphate synthase [Luteibaculaceae bacterium]|nr:pyridoxine 5'-phosphate synthase [Luteibaculaceae bacterium]
MTKLSVNINKVATLRNARGGNVPNVLQVALDCERFGAQGITVHPRPDQRHIRYNDVRELKPKLTTEFNIEGYPEETFIQLVLEVSPAQVTLVPDPPHVLTSNAGWETRVEYEFLKPIIERFKAADIRVSLFTDCELEHIEWAQKCGADRIELYTEQYAKDYPVDRESAVKPYAEAALFARELGLGVNAGHDLSLENLAFLKERIPQLAEVSIGHALISDALYFGLENTIQMYRNCLR